jgi:hypothetical protein
VEQHRHPGQPAWITKDGFFDPGQCPIDGVLKQAISDDEHEFRSGLNMLQSMHAHGRQEAGVFLLGLLVACDGRGCCGIISDNWFSSRATVPAACSLSCRGSRAKATAPPKRRP